MKKKIEAKKVRRKNIPEGTSDGKKTFWFDEGWPDNLPKVTTPPEPIIRHHHKKESKDED